MKLKLTLKSAIMSGALLASSVVLAEGPLKGWSGKASLGAVITSGNSDTRNISGTARMTKEKAVWKHTAFGGVYNSESNDVETANRFDLGYKLDRKLNDTTYVFGRIRYDSDEYGNIDDRFSGVIGLGKQFIDNDKRKLSGELGVGGISTTFRTLTPVRNSDGVVDPNQTPLDDIDETSGTVYGGLNYSQVINENVTFNSVFSFDAAEVNTSFVWDNSVNVKMSDKFSLSLGLLSRTNTDTVGQLGDKTDREVRASLVYGF